MEAYPNIYGDLSAGSGNGALGRDLEFAKAFITRRADRLMFGTDYLSPGQAVPQFDDCSRTSSRCRRTSRRKCSARTPDGC